MKKKMIVSSCFFLICLYASAQIFQLERTIERKEQLGVDALKIQASQGDVDAVYVLAYRKNLLPYRDTLHRMAKKKNADAMFFEWYTSNDRKIPSYSGDEKKKSLLRKSARMGNTWACYALGERSLGSKAKALYLKAMSGRSSDACIALIRFYSVDLPKYGKKQDKDSLYLMIDKALEFCSDSVEEFYYMLNIGNALHDLPKRVRPAYIPDIIYYLTSAFNKGYDEASFILMDYGSNEQRIYYAQYYLENCVQEDKFSREKNYAFYTLKNTYKELGDLQMAEYWGLQDFDYNNCDYYKIEDARWMSEMYISFGKTFEAGQWKEYEENLRKEEQERDRIRRQERIERITNTVNGIISSASEFATSVNNIKNKSNDSPHPGSSGTPAFSTSEGSKNSSKKVDPYAAAHESNKQNAERTYINYSNQLIDMNTNYERNYNDGQRRQIQSSMKKIRTDWEKKGYTFWRSPWEDWDGRKK